MCAAWSDHEFRAGLGERDTRATAERSPHSHAAGEAESLWDELERERDARHAEYEADDARPNYALHDGIGGNE